MLSQAENSWSSVQIKCTSTPKKSTNIRARCNSVQQPRMPKTSTCKDLHTESKLKFQSFETSKIDNSCCCCCLPLATVKTQTKRLPLPIHCSSFRDSCIGRIKRPVCKANSKRLQTIRKVKNNNFYLPVFKQFADLDNPTGQSRNKDSQLFSQCFKVYFI